MDINNLVRDALELKASYATLVDVADIQFDEQFRTLCEKRSNFCNSAICEKIIPKKSR